MHDAIFENPKAEAKQFDFLEGEWSALCAFLCPMIVGRGTRRDDGKQSLGWLRFPGILRGTLSRNDHQGPRSPRLQSENRPVGTYVDGHFCAGWLPRLARTIRRRSH
jgi:hypothetical protein